MQSLRIVAILSDQDICTGLQLVGLECYHVTTEAEFTTLLTTLSAANIGILTVSEDLAKHSILKDFANTNPQILLHILQTNC